MTKGENMYPNKETNIKIIEVGGYTKTELIQKLKENKIFLNELAERLIASDHFKVSKE